MLIASSLHLWSFGWKDWAPLEVLRRKDIRRTNFNENYSWLLIRVSKKRFMVSPTTMVDLVSVVPYWAEQLMVAIAGSSSGLHPWISVWKTVRLVYSEIKASQVVWEERKQFIRGRDTCSFSFLQHVEWLEVLAVWSVSSSCACYGYLASWEFLKLEKTRASFSSSCGQLTLWLQVVSHFVCSSGWIPSIVSSTDRSTICQ